MRSVWLVLLLVGCPYPRAMKQGAALVADGQYRAALAQYDRALEARPRSDDALAARAATVDGAVAEALAEARANLAQGAWETTLEHLAYVGSLRPRSPGAGRIPDPGRRRPGGGGPRRPRRRLVGRGLRSVGPRPEPGPRAIGDRPDAGPAPSPTSTRSPTRRWGAARTGSRSAALEEIARHEPDRVAEVDVRRQDVRYRWATVVAADADAREREALLGPALALRARAVEIAGRDEDRNAVERLGRPPSAGPGRDRAPVARTGGADRRAGPGNRKRAVRRPGPGLGRRRGGGRAPGAGRRLLEGSTTWVAEQPYIAGQRQIPNPVLGHPRPAAPRRRGIGSPGSRPRRSRCGPRPSRRGGTCRRPSSRSSGRCGPSSTPGRASNRAPPPKSRERRGWSRSSRPSSRSSRRPGRRTW